MCGTHLSAATYPCAATRRDGKPCIGIALEGEAECFAHFRINEPAWTPGKAGEARLLGVPNIPRGTRGRILPSESTSRETMHPAILRQLSDGTDPIEPLVGFEIVEKAVHRGCFSVASETLLRMEPANHWPSAAVVELFREPSRWAHASDDFASACSHLVLGSPDDGYARSAALGYLGAFYVADGDTSAAPVHWEAVTNPPPMDRALRDLAYALRWIRGPAGEFREQAIDLARIVRTVSVRQDLLTTWGFAVRRR